MKIEIAGIKDIVQIDSLNRKFFHEDGRDFNEIISSENKILIIAKEDDKIIGFAGIEKSRWNNTAKGIDIFIHPEYRRKGIGLALVEKMISEAKKMSVRSLIVEAPSESNALPLYLKAAFRKCGYNDRFYSNDGKEIAIFLSYDLNKK
jgi:N-acetylglutamate synthase-like GNAT family acetyltransferase